MAVSSLKNTSSIIVLDWGTSNFRAWLMTPDGIIHDNITNNLGIIKIKEDNFEDIYEEQLSSWFEVHGRIPTLASGMIGSRQGWYEAPYIECPAGPEELAKKIVYVPKSKKGYFAIVPGMNHFEGGIPDVMRGEETQVAGVIQDQKNSTLYILPGTHSKWVLTSDGKIQNFMTFMSGEMFSLLLEHSILGSLIREKKMNDKAFEKGFFQAFENETGMLHQLFSTRTLGLFNKLDGSEIYSFLSGLIIGFEIKEGMKIYSKKFFSDKNSLNLIGEKNLILIYKIAFGLAGIEAKIIDGNPVTQGLLKIAYAASILK